MEELDYGRQTVEFNMSIATLIRIDYILKQLSHENIVGDPINSKRLLKELYKETYPFLDDQEKQTAKKYWKEISEKIFIKEGKLLIKKTSQDCMDTMDFWLRQKLMDKGILMSKGEDPRFALK